MVALGRLIVGSFGRLDHLAEEEEVAGDLVLVALRIGVLGLDAPVADDLGNLRVRILECERVEGVVDAGERFREPESQEVAAQLSDRRGGVVVR